MRIRDPRPLARPRRTPAPIARAALAAAVAVALRVGVQSSLRQEAASGGPEGRGGAGDGPRRRTPPPARRPADRGRVGADLPPARRRQADPPARRARGGAGPRDVLRAGRDRARAGQAAPRSVDLVARAGLSAGEADRRRREARGHRRAGRRARRRPPGPAREVPAGAATLSLSFSGEFNEHLVGLYRVKAGERWYAFTQFEAIDARRAFPCFDEPLLQDPVEVRADRAQGRGRGLEHADRREEARPASSSG